MEVSFLYDTEMSTLADFKTIQGCIEGEGGGTWNPEAIIEVQEDGSFSYEDEYGNFVEGTISSSGEANGELSEGFFAMQCGDGEFYSFCTEWTASPIE